MLDNDWLRSVRVEYLDRCCGHLSTDLHRCHVNLLRIGLPLDNYVWQLALSRDHLDWLLLDLLHLLHIVGLNYHLRIAVSRNLMLVVG